MLHTCNFDLSLPKKYYIHTLLLRSDVSFYYCMLFIRMVHRLIKEALHILAPTRSLRNAHFPSFTPRGWIELFDFSDKCFQLPSVFARARSQQLLWVSMMVLSKAKFTPSLLPGARRLASQSTGRGRNLPNSFKYQLRLCAVQLRQNARSAVVRAALSSNLLSHTTNKRRAIRIARFGK